MKFDDFIDVERLLDDAGRREYLARLLACGALGLVPQRLAQAGWFAGDPEKLTADRSIHSLDGVALVNGEPASLETRIRAGDRIETRGDSEIVFAVGDDAFILRGNSAMHTVGANFVLKGIRLLSGGLLSVFASRASADPLSVDTPTANLGIRGTGVYLEAEPDLTYACTCYGRVALAASADPDDARIISTSNHDMPLYIASKAVRGTHIRPAPVINHSNAELKLLEAIVGRKPPPGFGIKPYRK